MRALVVNVKESKAKATRWARALGFTFPVLHDASGKAATAWAPLGVLPDLPRDQIPIGSNVIVDREGVIRFYSLLDSANFDARLVALTARLDELLADEAAASIGSAAADAGAASPRPASVVTVREPATITLAAGGKVEARLALTVAAGYHVQANPVGEEFLIPLLLELRQDNGVRAGKPAYPPGQPYRLEGTATDLLTYEGTVELVVPVRARVSARPGRHLLRGTITYQACDNRTCLFPASVPVTLPVEVK